MTRAVHIAPLAEPEDVTAARRRFVLLSVALAMAAGAVAGLVSARGAL